MSQKPETVFRQKLRKRLESLPNSFWESIQQKTIIGTPDILGCVNGHFVGLELKATEDSPVSRMQEHKLALIKQAGGIAWVVHPGNADNVISSLNHIALK